MALHGGLSFCKTQQVVGFDCTGIERLSVPQPNSCLLLGEPMHCFSPALSQARRGPTHPVTVMFYTRGAVQLLETHGHSTRQKTRILAF